MEVEDGQSNLCCALIAEKLKISTEKRNALRQGVKLLKQGAEALQKQVDALQTENISLKKELEEQRKLAVSEREEKLRESSAKCNFETEVNSLKYELELLQQKVSEQDRGAYRDVHDEELELEIKKLKACLEQENVKMDLQRKEVNRLKLLLDTRAKSEEKKLVEVKRSADESHRLANSEKSKAEEERRRADNESKNSEEYKIQLQHSKEEAEQVRKMLSLESSKAAKANKQLKSEKNKGIMMKKQADSMIEKLNKEIHAAREKSIEEESRADTLSRLLEEQKLKIEELQSDRDKYLSELRAQDTGANGLILGFDNNQKVEIVKKGCTMDMEKCHDTHQMSSELKQHGVDNLHDIPKLEHNRKSSRGHSLYDGPAKTKANSEEVKLLKKHLKLERERVTHAFEVAKLEKARCSLLNKELYLLKQDFLHLSYRMNSLDGFMSSCTEGIDGVVQKNSKHTSLLDAKDGYVDSISGINSELDPLQGGCPRKMLQSSAINSTVVSFSDKKLMGSQETNTVSVSPPVHFNTGIEKPHAGISNGKAIKLNFSENSDTVSDNSDRSAPNTEAVDQMNFRGKKRKRISSAIESIGCLHSESKNFHPQMEEKFDSLNSMLTAKKNSDNMKSGLGNIAGEKSIKRDLNEEIDGLTNTDLCPPTKLPVQHATCEAPRHTCQNQETTVQEMIAQDYLKVLDLDDPLEEEQYQMAIRSPMSPSIPDITFSSLQNASQIAQDSVIKPLSFIVFSGIVKKCAISKIVHATRNCFAQCSFPSGNAWALHEIIYALMRESNLLPKEKACAFFSLLLWHVSRASAISNGNFFGEEFRICCNSFSLHVSEAMDNANVRSIFAKLFNSDVLLSLIEEFLIYRVLLVGDDTHNSSVIEVFVDSRRTRLFRRTATADELVASGVILASLCSGLGRIDSLRAISYSILQINGFDRWLLLVIVHVFARLCGNVYLNLTVDKLSLTVMKSVVAFIEREESSCPQCTDCPFSKDAISLDRVIDSLLEKLKKFSSCDIDRHLIEKFSSSGEPECTSGNVETALEVNHDLLGADGETALEANLDCSDVLHLVEMLAFAIPWKCTCQKVVPGLLKITASCDSVKVSAVVITLLGQIGRFGADVAGFDDAGVLKIKSVLLSYMGSFAARKKGFVVQIALVRALLGLVPVEFSEIIADDLRVSKVTISSNGLDVVRTWFSSLSGKEKILCEAFFMQRIE